MPDPLSDLQRLGQEFDADVVEAVAETLALHALPDRYSWAALHESARELWREDARAAIAAARPMIEAEAFERAARVAEHLRPTALSPQFYTPDIAGAIRALIKPRP